MTHPPASDNAAIEEALRAAAMAFANDYGPLPAANAGDRDAQRRLARKLDETLRANGLRVVRDEVAAPPSAPPEEGPVPMPLEAFVATLDPATYSAVTPDLLAGKLGMARSEAEADMRRIADDPGGLLERWALLHDEDEEHEIDASELREIERSGEIVHPETGECRPWPDCGWDIQILYAVTSS